MKALTLTQPWASLVAMGVKRIETRDWATPYRGPLAIHAAKGQPAWAREFEEELYWHAGEAWGFELPLELPRGAVIATCTLLACERTEEARDPRRDPPIGEMERAFGDFSPGRWAWLLGDIEPLPRPVPARGALGLWEWER